MYNKLLSPFLISLLTGRPGCLGKSDWNVVISQNLHPHVLFTTSPVDADVSVLKFHQDKLNKIMSQNAVKMITLHFSISSSWRHNKESDYIIMIILL